jgi:hypothetical protein
MARRTSSSIGAAGAPQCDGAVRTKRSKRSKEWGG